MMLAVLFYTSETREMLVERSGPPPVYHDSLVQALVSVPVTVKIIDKVKKT